MPDEAIRAAQDRARADAAAPPRLPAPDGVARQRRLAVGDPQAPLLTFLEHLDRRDALDATTGRLRADIGLVTLGDYFDWGGPADRAQAASDGLATLAWLSAHAPDQIDIVVGNHDLARVGELADFDDASFARARAEADAAYHDSRPLRSETAFCAEWNLPSWEVAARDFSTFQSEQRALVAALLRAGRFRLAVAASEHVLLCHAGVTVAQLDALGVPSSSHSHAREVERALETRFQAAARGYQGGRFAVSQVHTPGDAEREGDGMLYHRAALDPAPRRFHPTALPAGLTQAVGHVRDKKSRDLLRAHPELAADGCLRTLRVQGDRIEYRHGLGEPGGGDVATVIFLDGGMLHAQRAAYQLLDLGAWKAS